MHEKLSCKRRQKKTQEPDQPEQGDVIQTIAIEMFQPLFVPITMEFRRRYISPTQ